MRSMRMDSPGSPLFRNRYRTWPNYPYTDGSGVIGVQMLRSSASPNPTIRCPDCTARALGDFAPIDFLRDVAEDRSATGSTCPWTSSRHSVSTGHLRRYQASPRRLRRCASASAHLIAVPRHPRNRTRRYRPAPRRTRPAIASPRPAYSGSSARSNVPAVRVMAAEAVVPTLKLVGAAALGYSARAWARRITSRAPVGQWMAWAGWIPRDRRRWVNIQCSAIAGEAAVEKKDVLDRVRCSAWRAVVVEEECRDGLAAGEVKGCSRADEVRTGPEPRGAGRPDVRR